jgi:tetratricopeptide (TPR) repeat protein
MMKRASVLAVLFVSLFPVAAWSQGMIGRGVNPLYNQFNPVATPDPCLNENPRVAIPACTRQLRGRVANGVLSGHERAEIYTMRANAYVRDGRPEEAEEDYARALRGANDPSLVHASRASNHAYVREYALALAFYDEAIALSPEGTTYFNNRAWLLATAPDDAVRDGVRAVADALKAIELSSEHPIFVDTLAAAYAEAGDFAKAAETQARAIEVLSANGTRPAIEDFQSRLDLYNQNMPYRETRDED